MTGAIAWAFLRSPLGQALAIATACAVVIGSLCTCAFLKGRKSEAPAVAAAQQQARTATAQATVTASAAKAADRAATQTAQVAAQAQEAAHVVQAAPGAAQALPDPALAAWRAQRCSLLHEPAAAPDCAGGRQPAPGLHAPGR